MNHMLDTTIARHWFMHTPHAAIGMGGNAQARPAEPKPPAAKRSAPRQRCLPLGEVPALRVGFVAGEEAMWETAAERLAAHFDRQQGIAAPGTWENSQRSAGADELDCLVLLGWPSPAQHDRLKRIEYHCRGGGNLVALRALHSQMPGWPDFAEQVFGGRQSLARRSRLLEAQRSDIAWHHPILEGVGARGVEALIAEGEVYRGPRLSPLATVLLTADDGHGPGPVAWTTRHEGRRVFCSTLGHEDDFREAAFLRLICNAVRWAGLNRR
jgi:hypothetical protein